MPFSINQMLGGWRRKEGKKVATKDTQHISTRRKAPSTDSVEDRASLDSVERKRNVSKEAVEPARGTTQKGKSEFAAELLISPHVSEKATMREGNYVFRVNKNSSKQTLKQAIENRYSVNIVSINILNTSDKKRRRGAIVGSRPGYKKAVVSLRAGQIISEF